MKDLGLLVKIADSGLIEATLKKVVDSGFHTCQVSTYVPELLCQEVAERIGQFCSKHEIKITMLWVGWPGKCEWNFTGGPDTVGLVPLQYREERCSIIKRGSDFAKMLGVDLVASHAGFIPENMSDPLYKGLIDSLKDIARHCAANGQVFCFETGQETPVTLLRTIQDVNTGNLGVNLDPANLVMYGKGNAIDSLKVLGNYVRGVHIKDGKYPTNGKELGVEVPIGEGDVDMPNFLKMLDRVGYKGAYTIEIELDRRVRGESPDAAISYARKYLEDHLR